MGVGKIFSGLLFIAGAVCLSAFPHPARAGCAFMVSGDYVCGAKAAAQQQSALNGGASLPNYSTIVDGGGGLISGDGTPVFGFGGSGSIGGLAGAGGLGGLSELGLDYTPEQATKALDKIAEAVSELTPDLQKQALGILDDLSMEELIGISQGDMLKQLKDGGLAFLEQGLDFDFISEGVGDIVDLGKGLDLDDLKALKQLGIIKDIDFGSIGELGIIDGLSLKDVKKLADLGIIKDLDQDALIDHFMPDVDFDDAVALVDDAAELVDDVSGVVDDVSGVVDDVSGVVDDVSGALSGSDS